MNYLFYILVYAVGIITGAVIFALMHRATKAGTLMIDSRTNLDKDLYQFSFDIDLDDIPKRKQLLFKVDPNADLSQK